MTTGEPVKPYTCPTCGKPAPQGGYCNEHDRFLKYACPTCEAPAGSPCVARPHATLRALQTHTERRLLILDEEELQRVYDASVPGMLEKHFKAIPKNECHHLFFTHNKVEQVSYVTMACDDTVQKNGIWQPVRKNVAHAFPWKEVWVMRNYPEFLSGVSAAMRAELALFRNRVT